MHANFVRPDVDRVLVSWPNLMFPREHAANVLPEMFVGYRHKIVDCELLIPDVRERLKLWR